MGFQITDCDQSFNATQASTTTIKPIGRFKVDRSRSRIRIRIRSHAELRLTVY